MADVKKRFEVHAIPGKAMRKYCRVRVDSKGKNMGGFDEYEEEVDAGYMVYLPNGSSIRCWDQDMLDALGFGGDPTLIDMETGDAVSGVSAGVLKTHSERKTSHGRANKSGLPGIGDD